MVAIEKHSKGPRLRVFGYRIHHGLIGIMLAIFIALHDRKDWKLWFQFK